MASTPAGSINYYHFGNYSNISVSKIIRAKAERNKYAALVGHRRLNRPHLAR
jgi:hypothetical protein